MSYFYRNIALVQEVDRYNTLKDSAVENDADAETLRKIDEAHEDYIKMIDGGGGKHYLKTMGYSLFGGDENEDGLTLEQQATLEHNLNMINKL